MAAVVGGIVGWFLWAVVTWLVGTKLLPEPGTSADLGQMLRTIGFSAAPGLLNVLGIIPLVGLVVWLVAAIWQLVAMVVAVRQALDYTSTGPRGPRLRHRLGVLHDRVGRPGDGDGHRQRSIGG